MTTTFDIYFDKLNLNTFTKYSILFLIAALVPTIYIYATDHIWEDFFITFKHSKNLVDGFGLVYTPGEKVHGFTSPINTILLSITYLFTGSNGYEGAIMLYRIASVLTFAAGISMFFYLLGKHTKFNKPVKIALFLVLIFEIKSVVYTSNGQEAAFLLFFTLLISILVRFESQRWILIGALCAGFQYTRPDGLIYFASIMVANFILSADKRHFALHLIPRYAMVCTLLYLPWFITMWAYYGSPIPNTVIAKAAYVDQSHLNIFEALSVYLSKIPKVIPYIYLPVNVQFGGWPTIYHAAPFFIGMFSFLFWLLPLPSKNNLARYFSLIFFFMCLYLSYTRTFAGLFSWYLPPAALIGLVAFCLGVYSIFENLQINNIVKNTISYLIFIIVIFSSVSVYQETIIQMKIQQNLVENHNRKQIGLWLAENTEKEARIYLEPLGYIGYFSGRKMLDFPGLVSPEVTRAIKKFGTNNLDSVITELNPDYLVLRPHEVIRFRNAINQYKIIKIFSVKNNIIEISKNINLHGINYLLIDSEFVIYRKLSE